MRLPPRLRGGAPWRRAGRGDSTLTLAATGVALWVGYELIARVALLFQNLYQSTYLLIPGAHLARDYWRSVDYGLGMAALVGFFSCLLLLVAVLEALRLWRRG
jgi:hypothetical protein